MTLAISVPLVVTVALLGFRQGFPSSPFPDASLFALALPLVGALLNRRTARIVRGSSLTSA